MDKWKNLKYIISYVLFAVLIALLLIFLSGIFNKLTSRKDDLSAIVKNSDGITYVIDAGHGGEDGGAVADDGTLEKELNLEMSKALCLIFELNGNDVRMTRETDTLLYNHYNDLENYKGKKKVYDLKNRVRIAEEYENPVFISIHMNKFPDPKYGGMQIYYSKNDERSHILADNVQKNYETYIKNANKRTIKAADSSIYVLNNLSCPAMLVECGFLSNPNDVVNLKTEEYRRSLCLVIATSALSTLVDKQN
jgi:N-acetylmuramoyl-L-alanine amidase